MLFSASIGRINSLVDSVELPEEDITDDKDLSDVRWHVESVFSILVQSAI